MNLKSGMLKKATPSNGKPRNCWFVVIYICFATFLKEGNLPKMTSDSTVRLLLTAFSVRGQLDLDKNNGPHPRNEWKNEWIVYYLCLQACLAAESKNFIALLSVHMTVKHTWLLTVKSILYHGYKMSFLNYTMQPPSSTVESCAFKWRTLMNKLFECIPRAMIIWLSRYSVDYNHNWLCCYK